MLGGVKQIPEVDDYKLSIMMLCKSKSVKISEQGTSEEKENIKKYQKQVIWSKLTIYNDKYHFI